MIVNSIRRDAVFWNMAPIRRSSCISRRRGLASEVRNGEILVARTNYHIGSSGFGSAVPFFVRRNLQTGLPISSHAETDGDEFNGTNLRLYRCGY